MPYSGGNFAKFLVLPGLRNIELNLNQGASYGRRYSKEPASTYFHARAGHEYEIEPRILSVSRWRPIIRDSASQDEVASSASLSGLGFLALKAEDFQTAKMALSAAVEEGDIAASVTLGYMYQRGKGVTQDSAIAAQWFERAAAEDSAEAQFALSLLYLNGDGMPQDDTKAIEWCRRAAKQGNTMAQHNLGLMYIKGQGVDKDYVQAYKWLYIAADNGSFKSSLSMKQVGTDDV